jgi:hypothetical protein
MQRTKRHTVVKTLGKLAVVGGIVMLTSGVSIGQTGAARAGDWPTYNAAPVLIDVMRNGRRIPALAETSKQGLVYILDRA